MSRLTRLACDTDGCAAQYPAEGWSESLSEAWRGAKRTGWERDFEQHRCPEHAPNAELVNTVRRLAAQRMPDAQIGTRVGLTRGGVQAIRYKHGIPGQRPGRPSPFSEAARGPR